MKKNAVMFFLKSLLKSILVIVSILAVGAISYKVIKAAGSWKAGCTGEGAGDDSGSGKDGRDFQEPDLYCG